MSVRIAAHVHSTWSYDGTFSLEEIAGMFARRGYDAVLLSEHDRGWNGGRFDEFRAACRAASSPEMVLVPGVEYSDADNDVHVLVWGCDEFLGAGLDTTELLSRLAAADAGIAVLAHPDRRGVGERLPQELLARFDGIEVWNRKYDGIRPGRTGSRLVRELGLVPFVGLDFHTRRQLFPLALEASGTDPEASVRSLEATCRAFGAPLERALSPAGRVLLEHGERVRIAGARVVRKLSHQ